MERKGSIVWEPKKDPPEAPDWLLIGVPDPSMVAGTTDVLIGGIRDQGGPSPQIWPGQSFSFQEGSDSAELTIRAGILSPVTDFLLMEQESAAVWIGREYLTGRLTDLQHVQVEIPAGYLSRPTALKLEPVPQGLIAPGSEVAPDRNSVTVYITSSDAIAVGSAGPAETLAESSTGPSISSVSPYPVPLMDSEAPVSVELKVYGDNFRKDQHAVLSNGDVTDVQLKTTYVSAHELHVQLPRDLWRHHRLSYVLVATTPDGACSAEVWGDE
jgi:hypothetical protein